MLNDADSITVVCESCGMESQQQVGRLRSRVGQSDLLCGFCHAPLQDYSEQLERIANGDGRYPFDKLRLNRT